MGPREDENPASPRPDPREANRAYGVPPEESTHEWGPPVPLDGGAAIESFPVGALPPWLGAPRLPWPENVWAGVSI